MKLSSKKTAETNVSNGSSISGCYRFTNFMISTNPLNLYANLSINSGIFAVNTDYKVSHRVLIKYGSDAAGGNAPLNLSLLSADYDRFRVKFDGNIKR